MRIYTVTINNTTPNTSNDLMTFIAASGHPVMIKRIRASGEATSSTVMRTLIQRSTGGTTGGGAITADKCNSGDGTANTVVDTTWSAQPTLSGIPHYNESWNAFGGGFDLVLDGREIWLVGTEQLSIRNTVGTGTMSLEVEFAEV
jgi:hypothetical protein